MNKWKWLAIPALMFSMSSLATDVEFLWTQELVRTDGTSATVQEVQEFKIYMVPLDFSPGAAIDATATILMQNLPANGTSYTHSNIEGVTQDKKIAFVMTVVDSDGLESGSSLVQILNMSRLKPPGFNKPRIVFQ